VTIFAQAYLTHRFLIVYLLPCFAVSAGLGLARLWRASSATVLERWCSAGLVGVALLSALPGNARLAAVNAGSESSAELGSPYRRIQRLAERVRPSCAPATGS
jgi:predicted exporter